MALLWLQLVALLGAMLSNGAASDDPCPGDCRCVWLALLCDDVGLTEVPAVNMMYIWDVYLSGNVITTISADSFDGLPSLSVLYLNDNALPVLDLGVFASAPKLSDLRVANNVISTVLTPPQGTELTELESLNLSFNRLEALAPDVFAALPALRYLYLNGNPLVLPSDGPLLVHATIEVLALDGVVASGLSALTLSQLPNVDTLSLNASGAANLSGAFAALPHLWSLDASDSAVATLPADAFAAGARLDRLNLSDSQLAAVEPGVLAHLRDKAEILIADTPLACQCNYQDLHQWALTHNASVDAACSGQPPCDFSDD